jgi:hypothetical protein
VNPVAMVGSAMPISMALDPTGSERHVAGGPGGISATWFS